VLLSGGRFNGGFNTHLGGIYQIGFCAEHLDLMSLAGWGLWGNSNLTVGVKMVVRGFLLLLR